MQGRDLVSAQAGILHSTLAGQEKHESNQEMLDQLLGLEVATASEAQGLEEARPGREDMLDTGWQRTATDPATIGAIVNGVRNGGSAAATTGTLTRRRSVHDVV